MKTLCDKRCGFIDWLWCKLFKKCPPPVGCCEPKKCERLRAELAAASPIDLPDGSQFVFTNQLSGFTPSLCPEGAVPTVEQLVEISKKLKVDGCWLCPMLVWATQNGTPVLAQVNPSSRRQVKVACTPSLCCKAYIICVITEVCIRLEPNASLSLSNPESITSITFTAYTETGTSTVVELYDSSGFPTNSATITDIPGRVSWTGLVNPTYLLNSGNAAVFICNLITR